MQSNIYINELRISLEDILNLKVLKYQVSELSSRHKKRIEKKLTYDLDRLAIFEGDVLFCVVHQQKEIINEKKIISDYLATQVRNFNPNLLSEISLRQAPEHVLERLVFAMISCQGAKRGWFTIYGRTLFNPTQQSGKYAHKAVDIKIEIEKGFIKIYLLPTYIALVNIAETYREQRHNLEIVGLCKYRVDCPLASKEDGRCKYFLPGRLGYYSQEIPFSHLLQDRQDGFTRSFEGCPKISSAEKVVLLKATRKAQITDAYPQFVAHARFSRTDLSIKKEIYRAYRDSTLMWSGKRFETTLNRIKEIFGYQENRLLETLLAINDFKIPIINLINQPHRQIINPSTNYKAIYIPLQQVVNDAQNPVPKDLSGGWLFTTNGSYDRQDVERIFEEVRPSIIVSKDLATQARELMAVLSDGEYKKKEQAKYDNDFLGINRPESRKKYGVKFINPWDEEDIYLVENPKVDYSRYAQDIIREWNLNNKDPNRIALVIIPGGDKEEDNPLYYQLKKAFIEEGIPSQFITEDTLKGLKKFNVAFGPVLQSLWLNIYTKMGGKPWRLANKLENVHAFIGIGFGLNPKTSTNHIYAGVAHIFDRYGSWLDVASGSEQISENDRESFEGETKYLQGTSSFKISQNLSQSIVYDSLRLYQEKQSTTHEPATNIILHKLGQVYECEVIGFLEGIRQLLGTLDNCRLGILQIEQEHPIRLYGDEENRGNNEKVNRTVTRGGGLLINENKIALATVGRAWTRDRNYFGIGTPNPLLLTSIMPSQSLMNRYKCKTEQFYGIEELAKHTMALTQLHWGSTKDIIRLPITTLYAQKVGDLISKTDAKIDTWSSYHRPWFL